MQSLNCVLAAAGRKRRPCTYPLPNLCVMAAPHQNMWWSPGAPALGPQGCATCLPAWWVAYRRPFQLALKSLPWPTASSSCAHCAAPTAAPSSVCCPVLPPCGGQHCGSCGHVNVLPEGGCPMVIEPSMQGHAQFMVHTHSRFIDACASERGTASLHLHLHVARGCHGRCSLEDKHDGRRVGPGPALGLGR